MPYSKSNIRMLIAVAVTDGVVQYILDGIGATKQMIRLKVYPGPQHPGARTNYSKRKSAMCGFAQICN